MTKQDKTQLTENGVSQSRSSSHHSTNQISASQATASQASGTESAKVLISGNLSGVALGIVLGIALSMLISALLWWLFAGSTGALHDSGEQRDEKQPLYWVAPMDDSYRRDKPGKSPMGMDLVPVYQDNAMSGMQHGNMMSAGTVMIAPNVQQNMGVRTQKVRIGYLNSTISVTGNVTYNEDTIVHIHPRVEGWVDNLFIKSQGEEVKQGQALYTLYSPELVSAQEEFLLALKRNDRKLIAGARARLSALDLSNAFIETLQQTQKVSQTVTFYAERSGVVEALTIREGFFVKPGTTIMSIAKLDSVWVIADVPETFVQRINLHDGVEVSLGFSPDQRWQSHIDYIYPSLDPVTRTLKVRVPVSNDNSLLKPNMFANVKITPREDRPSLLVPKSAVIRTATSNRVVVTDNTGHFKSIAVVLGGKDERYFEVTDGLLPDDIVVVSAQFLIDSESSKDSDLMRMSEPDNQATTTGKIVALPESSQASSINNQRSKITIARGPIEKWGRGPATMDFVLSPHIDLSSFSVGDDIVFTFVTGNDFTVVQLKPANEIGASSLSHDSHSHNSDTQTGNMQSLEHHQGADEDKSMDNMEHMEHMNHD